MKRLLCENLPRPHGPTELSETEAQHAVKVLRLRDGDHVEAIDGKGGSVDAILRTRGGGARLEYAGQLGTRERQSQVIPVTLEMAILKSDAMAWVIEKSVELGIERFVPVITERTVVQIKGKGPEAFQERWQKIADQALKQCGRLARMEVAPPTALEELLQRAAGRTGRLWCDEAAGDSAPFLMSWLQANAESLQAARILIGPEGGWSDSERELLSNPAASGATRIQLGPLVLRAETAALFAVSLVTATLTTARDQSELNR